MTTPAVRRPLALFATFKAVLWAFLGVRRKNDYQKDIHQLNPLHLMAMGIFLALVFVGGLVLLVNWVVKT